MSLTVAPEENGLYKLLIRAWGSLCEGEGPLMKLTVAGKDICVWSVDVRPAIYMSPAFELPAGEHEVVISFINDKAAGGEDRNLYLDGVAFGAVKSAEAVPVLLFDGKPLATHGVPREGTASAPASAPAAQAPQGTGGSTTSDNYIAADSALWQVTNPNMRNTKGRISYWGNAEASCEITVSEDGLYKMVIGAFGSPCQGLWPIMSLTVGDQDCAWTVEGRNQELYITPALELTKGKYEVKIAFTNDASTKDEDRNMFVTGFAFGKVASPDALPNVLFDGKPLSSFGKPARGKFCR